MLTVHLDLPVFSFADTIIRSPGSKLPVSFLTLSQGGYKAVASVFLSYSLVSSTKACVTLQILSTPYSSASFIHSCNLSFVYPCCINSFASFVGSFTRKHRSYPKRLANFFAPSSPFLSLS